MQSFAHFSLFCALNLRVMKKNIAIFASGSGSNTENIIRYFRENEAIQVSLVLSNRSDAYVLERAHRLGVPCNVFPKEDWMAGDEILAVLQEYHIDFVVLAGFLVRVLPKFGGKGMYGDRVHEAVVAAGEKKSGITIHYINERYDEGNIVFQAACPVLPTDSPEDVAKKVHALEYEHFPRVIERVLCGE